MNARVLAMAALSLGLATGCAPLASPGTMAPGDRGFTTPGADRTTHSNTTADRAVQEADTAQGRVHFGVAAGVSDGVGFDALADTLSARGYDSQERLGEITGLVRAWARLQLTPRFHGRLTFDHRFDGKMDVDDSDAADPRYVEFTVSRSTVSLTGEATFGPVSIEAGPALRFISIRYLDATELGSSVFRSITDESLTTFGGVVRASYRYPIIPEMGVVASAEYAYFPDAEPTETIAAPLGLGSLGLTVGLEWFP